MQNFLAKNKTILILAVIILLGTVTYINTLNNGFVWDDEFLITNNLFITSFKYLPQTFTTNSGAGARRSDNFYRPMQQLSYTIIYSLVGIQKWAFHLLDILLHIGNAVLIFFLIKKLFKKENLAFIASLLWLVHPIHTEAVDIMCGTADPMSVCFALASFLLYLYFREKQNWKTYAASLFLYICALLSKETIIILSGLFVMYEFVFAKKKLELKNYLWTIPFFAVAGVYFLLRLTVLNFVGHLSFYTVETIYTQHLYIRILTFIAALIMYYSFLFYPVNLHMDRAFPVFTNITWPIALSIAILVVLAYATYRSIKAKNRVIGFGILWFFICFIPMSGIIPVNAILLEHWLYFPSIGFFLIIAYLLAKLYEKNKIIVIVIVVILLAIMVPMTLLRNTVYKTPITFYGDILKYGEGTARVHNNLAMAYSDAGNNALAEQHYLKAIEIDDTYPQPHYNLAVQYAKDGLFDKAISHLERSIEINPNFFYAYDLLAKIYAQKGDVEKAEYYKQMASQIKNY
jgi:tetratricopeptide (TPR) repeat protein